MDAVSFAPDDFACTVTGLNYLRTQSGNILLNSVMDCLGRGGNIAVSDIASWRRQYPEYAVASAIAVAQSRLKANSKFPIEAQHLWAVPEALEQASSAQVARYKARKVAELAHPKLVLDLCCGIGGDMLALADIAPVIALDISAVRAWMAQTNAREFPRKHSILVLQADVANLPIQFTPGCFAHIDPARRNAGKRGHDFASVHPGPAVIAKLLAKAASGVVKLSPAVNFSTLPVGHLELISEHGTVVQALLWTGVIGTELGENRRTATVIDRETTWSICDSPGAAATPEMLAQRPEAWLYEVDGAVTRSGLTATLARKLNLKWLSTDGCYLTGPTPIVHAALTPFAVSDDFAYTESELFRRLKTKDKPVPSTAPTVEVKTRGGLGLNTDLLQKKLAQHGGQGYCIFIYRGASGKACIIARRSEPGASAMR